MNIRVGILGATGYVGMELVRLLSAHPKVRITALVSQSEAGESLASRYPVFTRMDLPTMSAPEDLRSLGDCCDIFFTSLPHGASVPAVQALHETGKPIIDMSGDFRYLDANIYEQWYKTQHGAKELLKKAVYGMPEMYKERIRSADIIGNPGCYTTASILALAPLLKAGIIQSDNILIDAKSGATGAGRAPSAPLHFCELESTVRAYGLTNHRHTSEIEQELSVAANRSVIIQFSPHLLPVKRGILATCYANLNPCDDKQIDLAYQTCYQDAPFVVLRGKSLPELKHVVGSNECHIGYAIDPRTNRIIIVSCIDNLIKGAAGQAIQNMNLRMNLPETLGLDTPGWYL